MISFRDMTFCPFYEDCGKASDCHRPLTPEVKEAAKAWWIDDNPPIAQFVTPPQCHTEHVSKLDITVISREQPHD